MPFSNLFSRDTGNGTGMPSRNPGNAESGLGHVRELLATLFQMAWFVEARDPYTGGHLWRVSRYAQLLAREAGLDELQVARAGLGGFLHDIGKIGIADAILRKQTRLTDEEYAQIRTHPVLGLRMLGAHPLARVVQDAVYLHHERPDGLGYPLGLTAAAIPLVARVVGISDAFDAMTSARPYRRASSVEHALAELQSHAGRQFDAGLVHAMQSLGKQGHLHHVQGHSDDGIRLQECLMCGPTLVLRRESHEGDHLYCRNCAGEYVLETVPEDQSRALRANPTGKQGQPGQLLPEADLPLISRVIAEATDYLVKHGLVDALMRD